MVITDLLWSDPSDLVDGWTNNFERGVSFMYGKSALEQFIVNNNFDLVCRSHQVVEEGY